MTIESVINAVGARFNNETNLDSDVTVHEVDFVASSIGGLGAETIDQVDQFVDKYGSLLKNLVGGILAVVMFLVFLECLKSSNLMRQKCRC